MFRRIRVIVVLTLLIAGTVYLASPPPTPPPMRYRLPDEVGFLEHRGKRYFLNDLFDPAFRAASDDRFVKQFDEGLKVADARTPDQRSSDKKSKAGELQPLPWAGRGPDRRVDEGVWAGSDP
ncbi:MAG TPA: hypothetical protein VJZ71_12515 [Phycisphaerae bacterium]|nr:hypothetical protein [Phycisphaerae bacterium]